MAEKSPILGPQGQAIYKELPKRVFDLIANVDAKLEGSVLDWPRHIQDTIFKAMETAEKEHAVKLEMVQCYCDHDVDTGYFVRVVCVAPAKAN